MEINDRIIGGLTVLGGVGVILGTLGFRAIPGQQFGSAFFPRVLGVALILFGLALIFTAARNRAPLLRVSEMVKGWAGFRVAAVLLGILGWVWLSPLIGFIATTALLIFALAMLSGGSLLPSAAVGLGMAVVLFLVFGILLRVPLPYGLIEQVLT